MLCTNCGERKVKAKGLCARCYIRKQRTGSPNLIVKEKVPCYGCGNEKVCAKGLCASCYSRFLERGSPDKIRPVGSTVKECEFCGKVRPVKAHGLCKTCYKRARDHGGDPNYIDKDLPPKIRECTHCGETKEIVGKGYCGPCYQRLWKKGTLEYAPKRYRKFCLVEGCDKPVVAYGFCGTHKLSRPKSDLDKDNHLRRKFKITNEEYLQILDAQNGVCAICEKEETRIDHHNKKPRRLAVDHDHETDKIRALLCSNCNTALGLLGDSPSLLRKAADYLEAHK